MSVSCIFDKQMQTLDETYHDTEIWGGEKAFTEKKCISIAQYICLVDREFANSLGDRGSIPGRVIPKTQKIVLDAALLNTQHYKVRIKVKVEQPKENSSTLPYTLV